MFLKTILFLAISVVSMLSAETIDLISPYNLQNEPQKLPIEKFDFRWFGDSNLPIEYANKTVDVKKTVVFNYIFQSNSPVFNQPRERLIYILIEPWAVDQSYLDKFSRVYSWDDIRVDNIKHFKILKDASLIIAILKAMMTFIPFLKR